jgi:hypothetical protein
MFVCRLLVGVARGADGLGRRGIVRECLDIGMTIHASERTVNRCLELGVIHMQVDLLPVLVLCKGGVIVTGQTIFVTHFG